MAQNTRKKTAVVDAVQMASAEIGHKPPQAPEVEEAVIVAMMLDADSVYMAMESLKEKSFYDPKLRLIFVAMAKLFNSRSAIDMMTVADQLRVNGTLKEIGGPAKLAQLNRNLMTRLNSSLRRTGPARPPSLNCISTATRSSSPRITSPWRIILPSPFRQQ